MPKEYLFLLAGLAMGVLLGWLMGRRLTPVPEPIPEAPPAEPPQAQAAEAPAIKLLVNGNTVEVPPGAMAEIQGFIQAGQKAEAIRVLREATGMNSAAAKSVVASLEKVMG